MRAPAFAGGDAADDVGAVGYCVFCVCCCLGKIVGIYSDFGVWILDDVYVPPFL